MHYDFMIMAHDDRLTVRSKVESKLPTAAEIVQDQFASFDLPYQDVLIKGKRSDVLSIRTKFQPCAIVWAGGR